MGRSSFYALMLVLLMFVGRQDVVCQEWNSARLSVLYGGSVPFNFNTLDKIKNGIEIPSTTRLGVSLSSSGVIGHELQGFVLNCRAFNNQSALRGEVYSLPLNKIRVKAENALGLEAGVSYGYKELASDWVPLFSFTNLTWTNLNWSNAQLNISLECGKPVEAGGNGSLLGEEPDNYNVELEFELVPTGPGF